MIQLEIRRTNSIYGSWVAEASTLKDMADPFGVGHTRQEAINDFVTSYKLLMGHEPEFDIVDIKSVFDQRVF